MTATTTVAEGGTAMAPGTGSGTGTATTTGTGTATAERLVGSDRVLAVLLELGEHPDGVSLDELSRALASSKPTVHRALVSLRKAGLADQSARGVYTLGDEFLRLAFRYQDLRPDTVRIEPLLHRLAARYGETAHYAVLDGSDVVYRAKVDPPLGAVRLTSTVGGRNPAWCTGVGKLLLSYVVESEAQLAARLGKAPLVAKTEKTIVNPRALLTELRLTRAREYGTDDQENEIGVNCVAVPVFLEGAAVPSGAISISGLTYRCPLETLVAAIPAIRAELSEALGAA